MALQFEDVRKYANSLKQYNYELLIPNVPGGGDTEIIRVAIVTTSIPGFGSEMVQRTHHGFVIKEAGRVDLPRQLPFECYETAQGDILQTFKNWHFLQWNPATGEQESAEVYKTDGYLILLNNKREESKRLWLKGVCIENVADTPLDGGSSEIVRVSGMLSYDDWDFV